MREELARLLARPIAHRGLHAAGVSDVVENSLSAANAAVAAGYGIECDVQLSRDGEAMVFHDDDLRRLTGAVGWLRDRDVAELGRLALGSGTDHVPTLAELLATIGGRVALVVEIKSAGDGDRRLADRTLEVLRDYAGPVAIESFDPAIVLHCRNRRPGRPIGLVGPNDTGDTPDPAALAASDFLSWSIDDLAGIAACHAALPRTTWTVRTPAQVECATRHGAQIVFEGFTPDVNDAREETGDVTR